MHTEKRREETAKEAAKIPTAFETYMRGLLPDDEAERFLAAMSTSPEVSIKLNRRKASDVEELGYMPESDSKDEARITGSVAWCDSGYYLDRRPVFTLNPLLHAGVFYVQDASSMIYETIVSRLMASAFDTGSPLAVADLCAAPGGKTTSVINAVPDGTLVLANEFVGSRANILRENLQKWGYPDVVVTNRPTGQLAELGEAFDIVAVDAPCSGEGMMRKDEMACRQWSPSLIKQCAALQREILADACAMLKPGGFLIYSTCTFNREEDESQVDWLAAEHGMVPFDPGINQELGTRGGIDTEYPCFRFMPHLTRGEGLFVAVMRKEVDGGHPVGIATLKERIKKYGGAEKDRRRDNKSNAKNVKEVADVPDSASVLRTDYKRGTYPETELSYEQAIAYLRHEALHLPEQTPRGYVVVTYKGHPLGLVKNIGSRANNLYPSAWRIKMMV